MSSIEDRIAEVLGAHAFRPGDPACRCRTEDLPSGWEDDAEDEHRRHVAAEIVKALGLQEEFRSGFGPSVLTRIASAWAKVSE